MNFYGTPLFFARRCAKNRGVLAMGDGRSCTAAEAPVNIDEEMRA